MREVTKERTPDNYDGNHCMFSTACILLVAQTTSGTHQSLKKDWDKKRVADA